MTSIALLNLVEFRLLIVETLSLSSNQETSNSEKFISGIFSLSYRFIHSTTLVCY